MITVLSGGTGTPKLLQGIKEVVNPKDLTIIVNTLENDYFSGVYVSADIDTVLYTMSDMINDEFWYGVKNDTFITHERLEELGCGELLRIGDIDRATKIQKTQLMEKYGLAKAVEIQAKNMGIDSKIIPMSEEDSEIKIITDIGELEFHDFLIKHQSEPEVLDVERMVEYCVHCTHVLESCHIRYICPVVEVVEAEYEIDFCLAVDLGSGLDLSVALELTENVVCSHILDIHKSVEHKSPRKEFSLCLSERKTHEVRHCNLLCIDCIDGQNNSSTFLHL